MKIFRLFIITLIAIGFASCTVLSPKETVTTPESQPTTNQTQTLSMQDYFPLHQGAYWVYEGPIRWTKINSTEVVEETIRWKMEVVRVIQRGDVTGFEMLGAPSDLAWYDDNKQRTSYAYILTGGKIYQMPVDTLQRLADESDTLYELVSETSEFFNIPLMNGQKICATEQITRIDGIHCWYVSSFQDAEPLTINGVQISSPVEEYMLTKMTGPDRSDIGFIPGIGISRYHYVHNGVIAEADLQLIEYFPGESD